MSDRDDFFYFPFHEGRDSQRISRLANVVRIKDVDSAYASRWVPEGELVTIAGREIDGGIYLGAGPPRIKPPPYCTLTYHTQSVRTPWIDPDLPVSPPNRSRWVSIYPDNLRGYAQQDEDLRGSYLDWLSSDKCYWNGVCVSYLLTYFYGLEFRFYVDDADPEERESIILEVLRLQELCQYHKDMLDVALPFLLCANAVVERFKYESPIEGEWTHDLIGTGYFMDTVAVNYALGRRIAQGKAIDADWVLAWAVGKLGSLRLLMSSETVTERFVKLFRLLFKAKYPGGIKVIPDDLPQLTFKYRAASGLFECDIGDMLGHVPDAFQSQELWLAAKTVMAEAVAAFSPYAQWVFDNPELEDSLYAHLLLPEQLKPPCKEVDGHQAWLDEIAQQGAAGDLTLSTVTLRIVGDTDRVSHEVQTRWAAEWLMKMGYGLVPQHKFALWRLDPKHPAIIYRIPKESPRVSTYKTRYQSALLAVTTGVYVARIGSQKEPMAPEVREALFTFIQKVTPGRGEQARLRVDVEWLTAVHLSIRFVKQLASAPAVTKRRAREAALSVAVALGALASKKLPALKRVYGLLGHDEAKASSDLHSRLKLVSRPKKKVAKRARDGVRLDAKKVSAVQTATGRVRRMLDEVLGEDEVSVGATEGSSDVTVVLDASHQAFLRALVVSMEWEASAAADLARQHNLMLEGAIEELNTWSSDRYDELLVEEYGSYELNVDVVRQLGAELGN